MSIITPVLRSSSLTLKDDVISTGKLFRIKLYQTVPSSIFDCFVFFRYVFVFFAQKEFFNFLNKEKRLTRYNHSKDSKKVKIFEIGSLEVYERGGECPGSTLNCVLTCMYVYQSIKFVSGTNR